MGRHVLPLVLVLVALVVRLILAASTQDRSINEIQSSEEDYNVESSIFNIADRPCMRRCYLRDSLGVCRLNWSCMLG